MNISYEEQLERKVKGGLMGMRNGTKEPIDVWQIIRQLRKVNALLAEDYENSYKAIVKQFDTTQVAH